MNEINRDTAAGETGRAEASMWSWLAIGSLIAHHPTPELVRVLELHPGGGMYDILRVSLARNSRAGAYSGPQLTLIDFNLLASTWSVPNSRDRHDLVAAGSDTELLAAVLGPRPGPGWGTALPAFESFGLSLLGSVLQLGQAVLPELDARMGWVDTSGWESSVRKELRAFPGVFPGEAGMEGRDEADLAAECWLLLNGRSEAVGALTASGLLCTRATPSRTLDLYSMHLDGAAREQVLARASAALFGISGPAA